MISVESRLRYISELNNTVTVSETPIKDLLVLEPRVFQDERGYFFESYNEQSLTDHISTRWIQDNESKSTVGVLRGLHYQTGENAQAKLVRSVIGEIFDVAVDLRPDSPTFKRWYGLILSGENKKQLYIPRGFAHGFLVLSDEAIFSYKCDNFYAPESEGGIRFDDEVLGIQWPVPENGLVLSEKDRHLPSFNNRKI